jgi:DNA-binding MarR family transcriptional regulator
MLGSQESPSRDASKERIDGAPLSGAPSFLLARANAISLARGNTALAPLGLKVRSYSVLALAAGPERPSQRELAAFLRLDPSQVVSLVDDLESQGLVVRTTDPDDRRSKVVEATERGHERAREATEALDEADALVFSTLGERDRALLADLLRRVAFND